MKRLSEQTLYEILEVPPDAAPPVIESAYERARTLYAPGSLAIYTLMTPDEAALLTSRIDEARRTLLDPGARARYDASLAEPPAQPSGARNGSNGLAAPAMRLGPLPPVIPAMQQPSAATRPPPADPEPPVADPEPPVADPAALLAAAVDAAGPVEAAAGPILLRREIPPGAAAAPAGSGTESSGDGVRTEAVSPPPIALTLSPVTATAPPQPASEPDEIPMPQGSVWTGEALRKVREARNITIPQIAERTKVTRHHVENIEGERFGTLPAPVYLRGILLSLARELRLDGQRVARSYLERAAAALSEQGGGKAR